MRTFLFVPGFVAMLGCIESTPQQNMFDSDDEVVVEPDEDEDGDPGRPDPGEPWGRCRGELEDRCGSELVEQACLYEGKSSMCVPMIMDPRIAEDCSNVHAPAAIGLGVHEEDNDFCVLGCSSDGDCGSGLKCGVRGYCLWLPERA